MQVDSRYSFKVVARENSERWWPGGKVVNGTAVTRYCIDSKVEAQFFNLLTNKNKQSNG